MNRTKQREEEGMIEIRLSEVSDPASEFCFPCAPESIRLKNGARFQSYDIIGKGAIRLPRGMEEGTISWDGIFFGRPEPRKGMAERWLDPKFCKDTLDGWMEKGTVLALVAEGLGINSDVVIHEFEFKEYGAYGNAQYSISFSIYRPLRLYTVKESNTKGSHTRSEPKKSSSYTISSGDTLWKIARKVYGSGSEWKRLYQANQSILEQEAKRRGLASSDQGRWIFSGITLSIP